MNCELCGKDIPKNQSKTVNVEGSELRVCKSCARHGREVLSKSGGESSRSDILKRIQQRRKKSGSSDIYSSSEKELALDYAERIKDARLNMSMTQEDLAKEINEKKSVIAKLEREDMRPSEDLRRELENTLHIELMEEIEQTSAPKSEEGSALTIGDLIEEE